MGTQSRHEEGIYGEEGSHQNIMKLTLAGTPREWIIAILLALSIFGNIAMLFAYRANTISHDLASYNASEMRVKAEVVNELQTILGCGKAAAAAMENRK